MEFFNPVTLFFLFTLQSVNLYQMDDNLAHDLSGTYVRETISEDIAVGQCPKSFSVELISTGNPDYFFLRNETHYQGDFSAEPRILPVDGKTHMLFTGQLVRAEVEDLSSLNVHIYNKDIPGERILETFHFNADGTLDYETKYYDDDTLEEVYQDLQELCPGARYKKVN